MGADAVLLLHCSHFHRVLHMLPGNQAGAHMQPCQKPRFKIVNTASVANYLSYSCLRSSIVRCCNLETVNHSLVETCPNLFILIVCFPPLLPPHSSSSSSSVSTPVLTGEHLRICPQGYTCCTSDMEDNLATLSRREMEGLLKEAGRSLQTSLTGQYKIFDGESVIL